MIENSQAWLGASTSAAIAGQLASSYNHYSVLSNYKWHIH